VNETDRTRLADQKSSFGTCWARELGKISHLLIKARADSHLRKRPSFREYLQWQEMTIFW